MLMKRWLSLALMVFTFCVHANENKTFVFSKERNLFHISTSLQAHTSTISSQESSSSQEVENDFSIISQIVTGEYFINDMFSFVGSYYFALVLDIDAEIQGLDLGIQYYPFENGTSKQIDFLGSQIHTSPLWSPYLYLGASTRDYQFSTVNLKFQGIEVQVGTYYHFKDNYFLKSNIFIQQHSNNNVRDLSTVGGSIGLGMKF